MALQTFTPLRAPAPGTTNKPTLKLKTAEFGDGYTQTTRDGLNHIRRSLSVKWETLIPAEADVILNFFIAHGGDTPFWYTPSDETTPVKWTCKEWDDTREKAGFRTITATFTQDFSLVM